MQVKNTGTLRLTHTSKHGIAGAVRWLAVQLVAGAIILAEVLTGGHGSLTQWPSPVAKTET